MKTFLEIFQAMAVNVGLAVPSYVVGNQDRQWVEALEFCYETGTELSRRVPWNALAVKVRVQGTGLDAALTIATDFDRLSPGAPVANEVAQNIPIRSISRSELEMFADTTPGDCRYYHQSGATIRFRPVLVNGNGVYVRYQSKYWHSNGASMITDTATPLVDDELLLKGLCVRWRKQKGMDYADLEAEYEAALEERAAAENGGRL